MVGLRVGGVFRGGLDIFGTLAICLVLAMVSEIKCRLIDQSNSKFFPKRNVPFFSSYKFI